MATWNSRGLRGSTLEELINRTNEQYREKGLALIQKIPTPITPVRMDKENRHITLAYFEQRSTVDYIGAVQGIPVCFDGILSYIFQCRGSLLLSSFEGSSGFLGEKRSGRTEKLPQGGTGSLFLSEKEKRISHPLSGRDQSGSGKAGLTIHHW